MSITFDPELPPLDLGKPIRINVHLPLEILPHFGPTINLVSVLSGPMAINIHTKAVCLDTAKQLSMTLFGTTESIPEPFRHWVRTSRHGDDKSVDFKLNHNINEDNLDPVYFNLGAKPKLGGDKVVFQTRQVEGGERVARNWEYEERERSRRNDEAARREREQHLSEQAPPVNGRH